MKLIFLITWTYVVFVVHTGLAADLAIGGCPPHLVLAGLFVTIARLSGRQALLVAAGWGLASGLTAGGRLGPDVIGFVAAAFTIQHLGDREILRSAWKTGLSSVPVVFAAIALSSAIYAVADGRGATVDFVPPAAAGTALYTGFLAAVLSLAFAAFFRRASRQDDAPPPSVSNKWRMLTE